MKSIKQILTVCLLVIFLTSCKKHNYSNCTDTDALYKHAKYPIGCAIDYGALLGDASYAAIANKQFNSITAENAFKMATLYSMQSQFDFSEADNIVAFAESNNKRVHGHTLIWHQQVPDWVLNFQGNKNDWEQLFKTYIQTVTTHFKGKVAAWDVVNEAFNEDGTLRASIWLDKIGSSYIEKAFRYVQKADNDALLFYNDYNLESNTLKRNAVLQLLNSLQLKGVKVNGVGLQMHINIYSPELTQIAEAMKALADKHYKVHLSELDISVNPSSNNISFTDELANKQAALLAGIVQHYNQLDKQYQYGITFWGVTDKHSWIRSYYNRSDFPLLYDEKYQPKPAYCAIKNQL